jgi:hypothetical protein
MILIAKFPASWKKHYARILDQFLAGTAGDRLEKWKQNPDSVSLRKKFVALLPIEAKLEAIQPSVCDPQKMSQFNIMASGRTTEV